MNNLPKSQKVRTVVEEFDKIWEKEKQKKKPSFVRAIARLVAPWWTLAIVLDFVFDGLTLVIPLLIPFITEWVGDPTREASEGFIYFAACIITAFVSAQIRSHAVMLVLSETLRIRTVVSFFVYEKITKLGNAGLSDTGKVSNLVSSDAQVFMDTCLMFNFGLLAPLYLIAITGCLYCQIGYYCFITIGISFLLFPATLFCSRFLTGFVERMMKFTDMRMGLVSELLDSIRVIKYYAWERPFSRRIEDVRREELRSTVKFGLIRAGLIAAMLLSSPLALIVTLAVMVAQDEPLGSGKMFSAYSFISMTKNPFIFLAFDLSFILQWKVSFERIEAFMTKPAIPRVQPVRQAHDDETGAEAPTTRHKGGRRKRHGHSAAEGREEGREDAVDTACAGEDGDAEAAGTPLARPKARKANKKGKAGGRRRGANAVEYTSSTGLRGCSPAGLLSSCNNTALSEKVDVSIVDATFSYPDKTTAMSKVNLDVRRGELLMVVGNVGSGKSTLAQMVLGELHHDSGEYAYSRDIAYVPQKAWIVNATIRENILCGNPYDEERYQKALRDSALFDDLKNLPGGDQTEIGERGITLSGGQKQRISIARALYSNRGIVILDDPLSAVDARVCTHIFENAILGALKRKTRIMVTNQLHLLDQADRIILMEHNQIKVWGTYDDLMHSGSELSKFVQKQKKKAKKAEAKKDESGQLGDQSAGSLVQVETKEEGSVGLNIYAKYCLVGGVPLFLVIVFVILNMFTGKLMQPLWLSWWADSYEEHGNSKNTYYLVGIIILSMYDIICAILSLVVWAFYGVAASRKLHSAFLERIVAAPVPYFDVTPIGRLINRFSKDFRQIDFKLPMQIEQYISQISWLLASLIAVMTSVWWLFLIIVPIIIFYYVFQLLFRKGFIELQRYDAITRSPIFVNLDQTLMGISSIRGYNLEKRFIKEFEEKLDENSKTTFNMSYDRVWFSQRLDWISCLITVLILCIVCISRALDNPLLNAASASMVLANLCNIGQLLSNATQNATETETTMQSVERIIDATNIEREEETEETWAEEEARRQKRIEKGEEKDPGEVIKKPLVHEHPPADWPKQGDVRFKHYQMKYRPGLPLVLKGLSFKVKHGEKIGVVGRTGSGKSTMMVSLFRIVEAFKGRIEIDGIDISKLYLHDLREKLAIIPQEPSLFSGTLRFNLDPLGIYTDEEVWRAVKLSHLEKMVKSLPGGLDAEVAQNGSNFSVGERQLLCMARAVLRNAKILVMDEATASVDVHTDILIQRTAREGFKNSTVFTIAHRLHTIMDSSRILVLDTGKIAEFDTPLNLLDNKDSILYSLAQEAGYDMLRQLAEGKVDIENCLRREKGGSDGSGDADDAPATQSESTEESR